MKLGKLLFVLALPLTLCGCKEKDHGAERLNQFREEYAQYLERFENKLGVYVHVRKVIATSPEDKFGSVIDDETIFYTPGEFYDFNGIYLCDGDRNEDPLYAFGSYKRGPITKYGNEHHEFVRNESLEFDFDNDHQGKGSLLRQFVDIAPSVTEFSDDNITYFDADYGASYISFTTLDEEYSVYASYTGSYLRCFSILKRDGVNRIGFNLENIALFDADASQPFLFNDSFTE